MGKEKREQRFAVTYTGPFAPSPFGRGQFVVPGEHLDRAEDLVLDEGVAVEVPKTVLEKVRAISHRTAYRHTETFEFDEDYEPPAEREATSSKAAPTVTEEPGIAASAVANAPAPPVIGTVEPPLEPEVPEGAAVPARDSSDDR